MLRTRFCELFEIDHPIVQASIGPWTSVELSAAVSNAGAIGTLGTTLRTPEQIQADIARMRELTSGPFIVNHTLRPLDDEVFQLTLDERPKAISIALGHRRELVERAHAAGVLFVQQVHSVQQAREAVDSGVDVLIAQGGEAGGFGGSVGTMPLVPQVVDVAGDVPVLAAGGIADGRGLAAALVLGAAGVNIGTRFLAAEETSIAPEWKSAILEAGSEAAVKLDFADHVFPPAGEGGYGATPRALDTPFVREWNTRLGDVANEAERLRTQLLTAVAEDRAHELVPFTGQTAGLVRDVLPAGEIVRTLVGAAEAALRRAAELGVAPG